MVVFFVVLAYLDISVPNAEQTFLDRILLTR